MFWQSRLAYNFHLQDFIVDNYTEPEETTVDRKVWQFWQNSIQVYETSDPSRRIRRPHVLVSRLELLNASTGVPKVLC